MHHQASGQPTEAETAAAGAVPRVRAHQDIPGIVHGADRGEHRHGRQREKKETREGKKERGEGGKTGGGRAG